MTQHTLTTPLVLSASQSFNLIQLMDQVTEVLGVLPPGPFSCHEFGTHPAECILLAGQGEEAEALAHNIDRDDAMALAQLLAAAEGIKDLFSQLQSSGATHG